VTTRSTDDRAERYKKAADLLRKWAAEEDDSYDWSIIENELNDAAMRCREPKLTRPTQP
jgi:hypothetical protein